MNQRTHTQAIPQYFVEIIFQLSKFRKYVPPMIVYMLQHSNWFGFRIEKGEIKKNDWEHIYYLMTPFSFTTKLFQKMRNIHEQKIKNFFVKKYVCSTTG